MNKFTQKIVAAASVLTILVCMCFVNAGCSGHDTDSIRKPALSVYQNAQKQVGLVISPTGQGSAVFVKRRNPQGQVRWFAWTAAHVVQDFPLVAIRVTHRTEGHKSGFSTYIAKVIAVSAETDCALLFINAPADALTPALFAGSAPLAPGTPVFAVGNFLGATCDGSVSTGIVAQNGVTTELWNTVDQSTAPAYPGSSGGPLYDAKGYVVGLIVGGMDATLNLFVPVRALEAWAEECNLEWALRGNRCPSDRAGGFFKPPPPPKVVVIPKPPEQEPHSCN